MAIVIYNRDCLVFVSRSSDLIQYGGILTKANMVAVRYFEFAKFLEACERPWKHMRTKIH